jgi:hypothetical protein
MLNLVQNKTELITIKNQNELPSKFWALFDRISGFLSQTQNLK